MKRPRSASPELEDGQPLRRPPTTGSRSDGAPPAQWKAPPPASAMHHSSAGATTVTNHLMLQLMGLAQADQQQPPPWPSALPMPLGAPAAAAAAAAAAHHDDGDEEEEEEEEMGGHTDGSVATSSAASVGSPPGLGHEEAGEMWGHYYYPLVGFGNEGGEEGEEAEAMSAAFWEEKGEDMNVEREKEAEEEEEEEDDQIVLRRPDGEPVCLSDSRWTEAGHQRALQDGWMPFPPPPSPASVASLSTRSSSISSLTSASEDSTASSSSASSTLSSLTPRSAMHTPTPTPTPMPMPMPMPMVVGLSPREAWEGVAEAAPVTEAKEEDARFLRPTTLAAVLEEGVGPGQPAVLLTEAVAPFRAVHASKGFTRLTGWHLHTLVAVQEDQQQQQQQQQQQRRPQPQHMQQKQHGPAAASQAQAQAQASPLFCAVGDKAEQQDDKGAQRAALKALLAEADVTGFARSTLWLQTAPAPAHAPSQQQQPQQQQQPPQPFVCRVSVVPVLDRPLLSPMAAGAGGVPPLARLFVPRLTHLKWTFERAHTRPAAGRLGQQ